MMQACNPTPPVVASLPATQWVLCHRMPSPTAQTECYRRQQIITPQQNNQQSCGLQNGQSSSQPISSSSDLQSRQMPEMYYTTLVIGHAASTRTALPNGQFAPLPAAQHGTSIQNLHLHPGHQASSRNTVPQQNYNMAPLNKVSGTVMWYPSGHRSANSAVEQNLRHQSVQPQYQPVNGPYNREQIHQPAAQAQQTHLSGHVLSNQAPQNNHNNQGQINGGKGNGVLYSTFNHYPATSQRLMTPSQLSNNGHQTGQSHIGNQVQHSLQTHHQPSIYQTENNYASYSGNKHQSLTSNLPPPPSYTSQHFITQIQNQRINQNAVLGLPQGNIQHQIPPQQCNTMQVSGYHSTSTVPAIQGNTHKQDLQLNNTNAGLHRSSQFTKSPTSKAPPPNCTELTPSISDITLTSQRHGTSPLSCYNTSYTAQQQNSSHIPGVSEYRAPVQRSAILKENEHVLGKQLTAPDVPSFKGMPSRRFRADTITEKKDGYKSNNIHGKLQNREDVAETLELSIALEKLLQQSHKSVAVVPPISQQVPSPEKKDHGTKTCNDGLPFKIEAVWTLVKEGKNMENDSNAPNLPKGVIEELLQFSGPHAETQESNKHKDESTVNSLISDTPSADVPQSKVGSATSRGPVCSTVLTAETPEDHNKVKTGESNCNIVDLSKVEVLNFTMENFNNWVKSLDDQPERSIKGQEADVKKHLLDLFWDGKVQNLEKQVHMFPSVLFGVFSQVSREEMQRAVFQYLQPEDLSKLAHGYHILKNNTNLPTEEFRSSWLNIDGQPAEIENILAEPISDLNLTTYALPAGFNTLDDYSEFELSTEVIHAATDCQNDKMVNKELAKSQVCESKSNDKISNTQEPSKKHEDGNLEKHQQQNGNMSPEESEASNEKEDTLSKIKRTECEQDGRRKSVTSSKTSSESVEQRDLSNDPNSNSDSELIKVSLLSPDDTRTIFKEQSCCDLQKEPSQLCQDETQDSGTPNNDSKDFCSSSKLIKFTCPHVANTDWNGEHFCPMCWEATPLLDLDMEEALFSPRGSSPNMRSPPTQSPHDQSCSSQSGNPDSNCTASSESSSIACSPTPKDAVSEVTLSVPDLNPGDAVQSYAQNLESPVVPVQPKTPRDSKNRLFKKSKLSKSKKNPVNDTFTADLVNKKASSKKPHPSDLTVTPAEDDQNCRDERKERGEERNPLIKQKIQSNAPQPDKPEPNVNVCSESSGDSSPSTNGVNMSFADPDPDLEDSNQSSNSPDKESELSAKSPDKEAHRQVHSESVKLTMAIVEEECEAQCLTEKIEKRKNVTSSPTTEARRTASPPRYPPCKKVKVRTVSMPDDDLFTPDIVVKKASTPNPHLNNLNATPSEEVQHPFKDERNKKGEERKSPLKSHCEQQSVQTKTDTCEKKTTASVKSQALPSVPFQPTRQTVAANSDKKISSKTKQTGQKKGMKKLKFALYGFNNGNQNSKMVQQQFYSKTKSSVAPVYITVLNTHETSHSYTDSPSAKQKVYSQWSSTFVETKKTTSSYKKCKNSVKRELEFRTQALKRLNKKKFANKEKQLTDGMKQTEVAQSAEDFVEAK